MSDPAYPGQWRVSGEYIEQIAKMTHWEYPEAVERFGRQLEALGISAELTRRGAQGGDLVMVDVFDFEFTPDRTNPYLPSELLEREAAFASLPVVQEESSTEPWRPFREGGFLDMDADELVGFNEAGDWDLLDGEEFDEEDEEFVLSDEDDIWMA